MIEQKSTPKKQKVGSLFFHLFNRLSLWLYTLLINSFPARLLTSYDTLEWRWRRIVTTVFGSPGGKFRNKLHHVRLRCAHQLEHSVLLRILDRLIRSLLNCPLNMYGMFFVVYGAIGAAVYFVADRLSVNYAGNITWGIFGLVISVSALPLLCSGKPLARAAFGSRIVGRFLRTYLGLEPSPKKSEKKDRGNTLLVYVALLLGACTGALTFFFHPVVIPLALLFAVLIVMVLYIPESGVLLACGTLCLWWAADYPVLCAVAIASVTLISYVSKMIRGKRVIHIQLIDFCVILLASVFALHGVIVQGSALSILYGIGYAILIAMYFPIVNLIRSPEWLNRSYKLLAFSGAVLAVISVLPFAQILRFMDMTIKRVDLSMMSDIFIRYQNFFGNKTMIGGILILMLPLMLTKLLKKNTVTVFFWRMLWMLAACISIFTTMHLSVWVGCATAIIIFLFTYSNRSLSAAMLLAFPVSCGAVWYRDLEQLFDFHRLDIVQEIIGVYLSHINGAAYRRGVMQSALQMSADHWLGVGFGDRAVSRVFPQYAPAGWEGVVDLQSTYMQLIAECGYIGFAMLVSVMLMFVLSVMTYLRWGGNKTTKVRVAAGLGGVIGIIAMGAMCNMMNNASLFGLFWLIVGLTIACLRTQYETHQRAVQSHVGMEERSDIAFRTK